MKTLKHAPDSAFQEVKSAIFCLEGKFEAGDPLRLLMYKARCLIGDAQNMNRKDKDKPNTEWEYDNGI